ncbi:MAG: helicase HerA domain-containing protein [Bacillota bacterium]
MEQSLPICESYRLELERFARTGLRVGIWASSGRGKSYGVGVFCEELLAAGIPVIAIDPEGELHTLRERFRTLVLGGVRADLPLPPGRGSIRQVLEAVCDQSLGLVIDLSDLPTSKGQQEAANPWLEELWVLLSERRQPVALVVEEVHLFAPQSGSALTAEIMQRFAKQGRKRGAILVAASQRTQAVSKEFMSQLNFPAIGGFETERDYEAVKAVVDGQPFETFRSLEPGCFYLPAARRFERWRPRLTSHGGDAPEWDTAGAQVDETTQQSAELADLVAALRVAFEQDRQAASPPDPQRSRVKVLEEELSRAQAELREARREVERLQTALQVAGLVKVLVTQEVVQKVEHLQPPPAPAGVKQEVVKTEARPSQAVNLVKEAGLSPAQIMGNPTVKDLIRKARRSARRQYTMAGQYMDGTVKMLLEGSAFTPQSLAARWGYSSTLQINRMGAVLRSLREVGIVTLQEGRYGANHAYLHRVITGAS